VVVVTRQLLGQLEASVVVGACDPADDPRSMSAVMFRYALLCGSSGAEATISGIVSGRPAAANVSTSTLRRCV